MGALPGMATTGAGMLGAGPASGLAGAAVSGLQGNIGGAVQGIGSTIGALAGLKGYSGLVGQLAKDAYKDVDMDTMMGNLGKQAALSAIFGAVPGLGVAYSLASLFGFDPMDFIGQITGIESLRNDQFHKERDFWSTIEQKLAMEDNPTPMDTVELGLPTTTNDDPMSLSSLFGDDFSGFAVDNSVGTDTDTDYGDTPGNMGGDLGAFGPDSGFDGFGDGMGPDAPDGPSSESADSGREGGTDGM